MMNSTYPFKNAAAREKYLALYAERSKTWPSPSVERMVPTALGETFVRISGKEGAAPLVMLPGVGSASYTLEPQARALGEHFRVYAVDNIYDVGRSISSRALLGPDDFVAWLDSLFGALELDKPNVLGLSYGGWVFTQYALRRPERVAKLVQLAPAGTVESINFAFIWRALLTLVNRRLFMRPFAAWAAPYMCRDPQFTEMFEHLIEDATVAQQCFAGRRLVPPLPLTDGEWGRLAVPTLFLCGDREVIFNPTAARAKLQRAAPKIQVELMEDASHDFTWVRAAEVNRRVEAFLT
jgi:pimeloyl-ACP methyl ester carboxylesterase